MTHAKMIEAAAKASLFLKSVTACKGEHGIDIPLQGSKWTSAVIRSSMDLTRALAEMRKP